MLIHNHKPGRRVNPRRKPRYCPDCGVGEMVKDGKMSGGKQIWRCRICKFRTVYPNLKKTQ